MFIATMKSKNMNIKHTDGTEILVRSGVLMCEDKYETWIKENYKDDIINCGIQSSFIEEEVGGNKKNNSKNSSKEDK